MGLFDKFQKKKTQENNGSSAEPTTFDLKVSNVEACKIDYTKSVEELTAFYDEQSKKIEQGDREYLNGEFMQLGYALDFIGFVQQVFRVTLDFEEGVVPAFESVLDAVSQGFQQKKLRRRKEGDRILQRCYLEEYWRRIHQLKHWERSEYQRDKRVSI